MLFDSDSSTQTPYLFSNRLFEILNVLGVLAPWAVFPTAAHPRHTLRLFLDREEEQVRQRGHHIISGVTLLAQLLTNRRESRVLPTGLIAFAKSSSQELPKKPIQK